MLLAWGVLVVGSIDNVLSPRLVGKRTRLHELLVFFSVLGGLQLVGVLGVVLGPVTIAVTLAIIEMVRQANRPPSETLHEEGAIESKPRCARHSGSVGAQIASHPSVGYG